MHRVLQISSLVEICKTHGRLTDCFHLTNRFSQDMAIFSVVNSGG
jgi:hypothetical protein